MALKDLTKLVEDSLAKQEEEVAVEVEHDILHESADEVDLGDLITQFYEHKAVVDEHKNRVDKLNAKIKEVMAFRNISDFKANGFEAVVNTQNRASLNEDSLITKLRDMGEDELITTKEIPDIDLIEEKIYNKEFNAAVLVDCMEYKEVKTLKVKKAK